MTIRPLITLLAVSLLVACANPKLARSTVSEDDLAGSRKAVEHFRQIPELETYFENAVAWAVYPYVIGGGFGFGGAYGNGWTFRGEVVDGKSRVIQAGIGAQIIARAYRHIIFFETEAAYRRFQQSEVQFVGQAHAALVTLGGALTPAYQPEVASFSQLVAGVGLEASVGAHRYSFIPVSSQTEVRPESSP